MPSTVIEPVFVELRAPTDEALLRGFAFQRSDEASRSRKLCAQLRAVARHKLEGGSCGGGAECSLEMPPALEVLSRSRIEVETVLKSWMAAELDRVHQERMVFEDTARRWREAA